VFQCAVFGVQVVETGGVIGVEAECIAYHVPTMPIIKKRNTTIATISCFVIRFILSPPFSVAIKKCIRWYKRSVAFAE